jgi:tripartite ATP-independent transporter DctP family solute receptor
LLAAGSSIAAIAVVRAPALAAAFEYKAAHGLPIEHPLHVRMIELWEAVKKETNGRLVVTTFPNSQLGGQSQTVTQLRLGAVQFFAASSSAFSDAVPVCDIDGVGFAFRSSEEAWRVMDGALGDYVRDQFTSRGLFAFPRKWDLGMRQLTSSTRAIRNVADFNGFKIRVPIANLSVDFFRTLGAAPVTTSSNELYTSLQTKIADGQESPLLTIETFKLYEVQRYLTISNHMWNGTWFVANLAAWKALPADIQTIVMRNLAQAVAAERRDSVLQNASLADKLRRRGMQGNVIDGAAMRARLGPYYTKWRGEFGGTAWGLLESGVGRLA